MIQAATRITSKVKSLARAFEQSPNSVIERMPFITLSDKDTPPTQQKQELSRKLPRAITCWYSISPTPTLVHARGTGTYTEPYLCTSRRYCIFMTPAYLSVREVFKKYTSTPYLFMREVHLPTPTRNIYAGDGPPWSQLKN